MREDARPSLKTDQVSAGIGLAEVLPFLVGLGRTGRLSSAAQDTTPSLEVWIERGRVVDAAWGRLQGLIALEMGAVFLSRANFVFSDGLQSQNRTFDLSPTDLALRLAEVALAGNALVVSIPGPLARPKRLDPTFPRLVRDPEATRLLDRIDGTRSVADLVDGRQPLVVLRGLASLVAEGSVDFEPHPVRPDDSPQRPVAGATLPLSEPPPAERPQAVPAKHAEAPPAETAPPVETAPRAQPMPRRGRLSALQARRSTRLLIVVLALVPLAIVIVNSLQRRTPEPQARVAAPTLAEQATAAPTAAPMVTLLATATSGAGDVATAPAVAVSSTGATPAPPSPAPTRVSGPVASPSAVARTLLDERFATGAPGWPVDEASSAWWDSLGYHLEPRLAGQHVAIAAPANPALGNVTVTGLFRKAGGPAGGGYGVILRAQGLLDGQSQAGSYYVFEVGDRGQVGAWRRDESHWVDLLTWTASDAVNASSENRLSVVATGSQFTFSVNEIRVFQVTDATLTSGAVGVFTGGDGNHVLLEQFTVATP